MRVCTAYTFWSSATIWVLYWLAQRAEPDHSPSSVFCSASLPNVWLPASLYIFAGFHPSSTERTAYRVFGSQAGHSLVAEHLAGCLAMPSGSSSTVSPRLTRRLLEKLQSPTTQPSSSLSTPTKRSLPPASGATTHAKFTRTVAASQSLQQIAHMAIESQSASAARGLEQEEIQRGLEFVRGSRPGDRMAAARSKQLSMEFVRKRNEARRATKARHATRRQKGHAPRLRAALGKESVLESLAVSHPVREDYARRLKLFWAFAQHWGLRLITDREFDNVACDWADFQFLDGEGCHVGEKLKAALDAWATISREKGCLPMPRYKRVMRSWKKNAPKQSRLLMPEEFAFLISAALCFHHAPEMGLFHIALFCTFLRPSALLSLGLSEVVPPVRKVAG